MALGGCRGPEMDTEGFGEYERPQMGVNGLGWVWMGSRN